MLPKCLLSSSAVYPTGCYKYKYLSTVPHETGLIICYHTQLRPTHIHTLQWHHTRTHRYIFWHCNIYSYLTYIYLYIPIFFLLPLTILTKTQTIKQTYTQCVNTTHAIITFFFSNMKLSKYILLLCTEQLIETKNHILWNFTSFCVFFFVYDDNLVLKVIERNLKRVQGETGILLC